MYAVTRRYTHATPLIDAIRAKAQEVEDLIRGLPGFVNYYAMNSGPTLVTVSVFESREGADESTRRVREWAETNLPKNSVAPPETSGGDVIIHFTAEQHA